MRFDGLLCRNCLLRLGLHDVAEAGASLDDGWIGLVGLQLGAQARNPDAQVLKVVYVFRTPNTRQQFGVEHDLAGVGGEALKQQPLSAREADRLAGFEDEPSFQIDFDVTGADNAADVIRGPRLASQHGPHASAQLFRVERLGQVVVGAQFEAADYVIVMVLAGQKDDGDIGALAQAAHNFEAVHVRHHDVQHNDVGPVLFGKSQGFVSVFG